MPLIPGLGDSSSATLTAPKGGGGRQYTLSQLIAAQESARREKDRSFLGKVFHGGKGGVVFGLRQIMRPSMAVTTGLYKGLEGKGAFDLGDATHGAREGFMLRDPKTGSNILTELGWGGGGKWKSVAGFGLDVVTDPTLLLQVGATVVSGGTLAPALLAGRAAIAGFSKAGVNATARHAAAKSAVKALEDAGEGFAQRKSLAHLEQGRFKRELDGGELNEFEAFELQQARVGAKVEETLALQDSKRFQITYGIPFTRKKLTLTPASIGGKKVTQFGETIVEGGRRVTPKTPSLLRTAKGGGVLAKIPGMSAAARATGNTFKHGFMEEDWAKPLLAQAHMAEQLFDKSFKVAHETVGRHAATLSKKDMRGALSWAQKRETLVTRNAKGTGTLHKAELQGGVDKGSITQAQANFVDDWHKYWEFQTHRDKTFGVAYDKNLGNKIYVPHIYQQNGGRITKSDVAKAGFQRERIEDLTLDEMHLAAQSQIGKNRNWIADPMQIMAIRTRRGANAQSKEVLFRHLRRSAGVQSRIPNVDKIAKYRDMLKAQEARYAKSEWSTNSRLVGARKAKITNMAKKSLTVKLKKIDAEYTPQLEKAYQQHLKAETLKGQKKAWKRLEQTAVTEAKSLKRRRDAAVKRAEAQVRTQQRRDLDKLETKMQQGWRELMWANEQTIKIDKRLANGPTKKNPNIPDGYTELKRRIGGDTFYFNDELHQAMTRVETTFRSDADMEKVVGAWDRAQAKWKIGVTSVNPGYRVRNSLSDVWNMYIAGVPAWAIPVYAARADRLQRVSNKIGDKIAKEGGKYTPTSAERKVLNQVIEAHSHGILSGLFGGDVETVARLLAQKSRGAKAEYASGHFIRGYARMMGDWNRRWEDKGRLTHYLYRREHEKMGVSDAADWVKKAHFDYTELTAIEREKFKKVLPFYTWTRKNIPYQLVQMAARPGKYATFPKAINMFDEMATEEDDGMAQPGMLPDWMGQKMAFRIPFFGDNAMTLPLIGVTDLTKIDPTQGVGNFFKGGMSMVTPFIKTPYEIATGRSMLTGQEINDGSRKPISGFAASVLGQIPGTDVGTTSRNVRGERVEGEGANPWVSYIAGQLPMTNTIVNQSASINRAKRGSNPLLSTIGYVGGLAIYDRDLEAEQAAALIENREKVAQVLRNLRRSGVVAPSNAKRGKFEEQVLIPSLKGG